MAEHETPQRHREHRDSLGADETRAHLSRLDIVSERGWNLLVLWYAGLLTFVLGGLFGAFVALGTGRIHDSSTIIAAFVALASASVHILSRVGAMLLRPLDGRNGHAKEGKRKSLE